MALAERDVARVLACHRATVRRLIRRGELRSFKVGRCRRVWASEVRRFAGGAGGEMQASVS
jgi:excisionase family DNA binding protein